jgi:TRAP-type transport system small permease protein
MWLGQTAGLLGSLVKPISWVFQKIGGIILALMMILTTLDVILRDTINKPITGTFDLTEYMMAIMVSFGLAYCAILKGHINADVVIVHLKPRVRIILETITTFLSLVFISAVTWQLFVHMKAEMVFGLKSSVLPIPVFPFVGVVGVGMALFSLVLLKDLLLLLSRRDKT